MIRSTLPLGEPRAERIIAVNKLIPLISLACLLPLPCAASPVEWDFVDAASQITVASLTLTGPDSTGSATFGLPIPTSTAIFTGDSFSFDYDFPHHEPLTSSFVPDPFGCAPRYGICNFRLSWSEIAGQLTAVSILVNAFDDSFFAGLSDAVIGSMGLPYPPCPADESCRISGSWVNAPASVPEPNSFALIAVAFGFLGLVKRYGRSL
jgi:hypothetical protein